jgi:hypothetical protein
MVTSVTLLPDRQRLRYRRGRGRPDTEVRGPGDDAFPSHSNERCVTMQRDVSPEHAAVLHVLTAPQIARRAAPYLTTADPDFAGLGLEAETMSSGQALLVDVARDLWTAERTVGLVDVVRRLDPQAFARVVQALTIARGLANPRGVPATAASLGEIAA